MRIKMNGVKNALLQLGCKGRATAELISINRYMITLNGQYFGIFDADRQTFVD